MREFIFEIQRFAWDHICRTHEWISQDREIHVESSQELRPRVFIFYDRVV